MLSQIGSMLLVCCLPMLPVGGDEEGVQVVRGKPGQESLELRRFAIQPLVSPYITSPLPIFGRVFGRRAWEKARDDDRPRVWSLDGPRHGESARFLLPLPGQEEPQSPIGSDTLMEYIRMSRPEADWEREGTSIMVYQSHLLQMTERKEALDEVKVQLESLRQILAARHEFRCLIYELSADETDPAGGVMDAAAAAALEKRVLSGAFGRSVYSAKATGRLGDTLRFGKWRRDALQIDADVEIAQEAVIADPVVEPLLLGHNLIVNAILAPDGRDLALFGLFTARTKPSEFTAHDVGAVALEMIELGSVKQVQSAFSVRLPASKGGLVLRAGGASRPGLRLLLICNRIDPWSQEPASRAMLPIGLLTAPALTCEEEGLAGINTVAEPADIIIETIGSSVGGGMQCEAFADGAFLFVAAAPEKVAAARGLVKYLGAARTASFRLDLLREARPVESAADAAWREYGVPVEMFCLGGRLGFAMAGREQLFIGDYEVEVAQKAKVSDPAVFACFDGLQAVASTEVVGEQVMVRLAMLERSLLGWRTVPAASPDTGSLRVPDLEEVTVRQDLMMQPGATVSLGDGPTRLIPGRGKCRTRLSIRLTRL